MTIRKRRNPTPHFRMPPPWNPLDGEHASLVTPGISPHCAMMQVAAEDTHDNYVICRGYDPRIKKFFDYVEGKPGIPVAKPWSNRGAGAYTVGQIFPAVIPLTRIGQTPGVRDPGEDEEDPLLGQPADLDEEIGILYTEDGKVVNWLLLEAGGGSTQFAILDATLNAGSSCEATIWSGDPLADSGNNVTVYDWWLPSSESLSSGTKIAITQISGKWYVVAAWIEKTVVTDVTIIDGKLKKKTASIVVFWAGSDSTWSTGVDVLDSSDFDEKAIVTDLQVSGTTFQKKTLTGKIYNPDGNSGTGWTTWHAGSEC